jgi:hypothetical protein
LRTVVGLDVWPAGACKPAAEGSGEGHGFDVTAFLQTQFERVDIVIESAGLNVPVSEPNGKEDSLSHAMVAPITLLKFQHGRIKAIASFTMKLKCLKKAITVLSPYPVQ